MRTLNPLHQPMSPRSAGTTGGTAMFREALFASQLQSSQQPSARDVRAAVSHTLSVLGVGLCAARVAEEFGEHPENAMSRMRWATEAVAAAYRDRPNRELIIDA